MVSPWRHWDTCPEKREQNQPLSAEKKEVASLLTYVGKPQLVVGGVGRVSRQVPFSVWGPEKWRGVGEGRFLLQIEGSRGGGRYLALDPSGSNLFVCFGIVCPILQ